MNTESNVIAQAKKLAIGLLCFVPLMAIAAPETALWTTKLKGNISSSVALGSNLYVGTADGKIQAVNPTTGAIVWSFTTGDNVCATPSVCVVGATPAVSADGTVVYAASYDKNLYAINAATGTEKWRFTTDAPIFSSPTLDESGVVYVVSTSGIIYVVDPASGEELNSVNFGVNIDSSPAILSTGSTTEIVFGSADGAVHPINVASGYLWNFATGNSKPMSSPVIGADKTIYIGSHDGFVYALNHADGSVKWKRQLNGRVASSLSIDKNTLYVASYDFGTLYALDLTTGAVWWEHQTNGVVFSTSAVGANGKLYIGTKTSLLAINQVNGELAWSYTADSPVAASPVINAANGNVYAITQNGTLFALTGDGTTLAPSAWSMFRQNSSRDGMLLDTDGDGIPDSWETAYGLNKNNASDATGNTDGDTLTNLQEFLAGTLPNNADTDGDSINDGVDAYPTHTGSPVSFLALADRIVTAQSNPITILGSDLMANDTNPNNVSLSITATANTPNTVNTKPTVSSGNLSYTPATVNTSDEFAYTLSGGGNTRQGLVAARISSSASDVIGTANNEIVYAGGTATNTDAGAGNDLIYDDADGDDTFLQAKNDGHDRLVINDTTARNDILKFKSDVAASEINLYKDGVDLIFNVRQSNSDVTVTNMLRNQTNSGVTAVQFANGNTAWDITKLRAIDDHFDVVATNGVIMFTPNTVALLSTNDFVPFGIQYSLKVVSGTEMGGTVELESSWIEQHVVFTLSGSATSGSFQYKLTDTANSANYTIATVQFNVVDSDVTGITFDGNTDDNVLDGTAGNDTFNSSTGFDIINGYGGEDTVNFGLGGGKDTLYYMSDDGGYQEGDGAGAYGDTVNLSPLNRADVALERQGQDIVARIKSTGENIRLLDHNWQEASINAPLGTPNGVMPFKQVTFADASVTDTGFTKTTSSALVDAAKENATKNCTVGGVTGQACVGTTIGDKVDPNPGSKNPALYTDFDMLGSSGDDIIFGLAGDDRLTGNAGDDTLYGGLGVDFLNGNAGNDALYGDQGTDWLSPGAGVNYLNGGSARDFYQLDQNAGTNIIDNFDLTTGPYEATKDLIWFNSQVNRSHVKFFRIDDDLIVKVKISSTESVSTVLNFFSFSGYNELDAKFANIGPPTGSSPVHLNGSCYTQASDGLASESGTGDSGFYCIQTRVLFDMTNDGFGGDAATGTGHDPAPVNDILTGTPGADVINGYEGNDTIRGGEGADTIHGGLGDDAIYPDYPGGDTVHGDAGDDYIHGNLFSDSYLYGDAGSDHFIFDENEVGFAYDAGPNDSAQKDILELRSLNFTPHNYWLYIGDADGDSQSDDLIINIIGAGYVAAIIDWDSSLSGGNIHQLDAIQVGFMDTCSKINRSSLTAYMAAIITIVGGGSSPTTAQMDEVIGNSGTYWNACGG